MFYEEFICFITKGKYPTFKEFEIAANEKEIFFKSLNDKVIIFTKDTMPQNATSYDFFSKINTTIYTIENTIYANDFNLREFLVKEHEKFIQKKFSQIAEKYRIKIDYCLDVSIKDNINNLFEKINGYILHENDFKFFSYFLD